MDDRIDVDTVLSRIKQIEGVTKDAQVATALQVDPRNLSNWKSRGAIPPQHLIAYCRRRGISMEWLINGHGPARVNDMAMEPGAVYRIVTDQDVMYQIAASVYRASVEYGRQLPPEKFAGLVRHLHREALDRGGGAPPYEKIRQLVKLAL